MKKDDNLKKYCLLTLYLVLIIFWILLVGVWMHEICGHALAAKLLGLKIIEISLNPFDAYVRALVPPPYSSQWIIFNAAGNIVTIPPTLLLGLLISKYDFKLKQFNGYLFFYCLTALMIFDLFLEVFGLPREVRRLYFTYPLTFLILLITLLKSEFCNQLRRVTFKIKASN